DAPNWLKYAVAGLGGLTAVGSVTAGTLMVLTPRMVELYDSLGRLGRVGSTAQRGIRGFVNALPTAARVGAVAAGFAALAVGAARLYAQFADNRMPAGIEQTTAALLGIGDVDVNSLFDFGSGFDSIGSSAEKLLSSNLGDRINRWAGEIGTSLGIETNDWGNA